MKKYSRRISTLKNLIKQKSYSIEEGICLLKRLGTAKFIESTEAHFALNVNPKYADQQLRSTLVLPFGTGNSLKIAVLTDPENFADALALGVECVGSDDLISEISLGKLNFDVLITTPNYMPKLAKLGRILGPKGLMPSPRSGTVTQDLKQTITLFKQGKLEYRVDKTGIVHLNFGKITFSENQLKENLLALYNSVEKNKPKGVKGKYFKTIHICTTMSPAIKIQLNDFKKA